MNTLIYIFKSTNPFQWGCIALYAAAICMSLWVPVSKLLRMIARYFVNIYRRIQFNRDRREIKNILTVLYYAPKQA